MCVIYVNIFMLFNSPIKGWMPLRMKGTVSANESVFEWYCQWYFIALLPQQILFE